MQYLLGVMRKSKICKSDCAGFALKSMLNIDFSDISDSNETAVCPLQ